MSNHLSKYSIQTFATGLWQPTLDVMPPLSGCTTAATQGTLSTLLQTPEDLMTVDVMNVQQQKGGSDSGIFAMAFTTSLVFGQCPTHRHYTQKQMRQHLVQCLENEEMTSFLSRKVNQKYLSEIRCSYSLLIICTCREVERDLQIQCNHCNMWYHIDYVNLPPDSLCLNGSFCMVLSFF